MGRLQPDQLQVTYLPGVTVTDPVMPRRYTLTHSDRTGAMFISVGAEYNRRAISGWYTRLMRDEVLAEWGEATQGMALHVYVHVSGGFILGRAGWRAAIFRRELPLVLEAIRYGDNAFFMAHPECDHAPILVHFQSSNPQYDCIEEWGTLQAYCPNAG